MANHHLSGILWDLDGVLVDTGQFHYQSWMDTMPRYGIPFDWDTFLKTFGMNNAGILTLLLGKQPEPALIQEISDLKELNFRNAIKGRAKLLPGVQVYLDYFHREGIPQAVASSAPLANITFLIDELGIAAYFAAAVSAFELPGKPSKPDPGVFLEAARQIDASPVDCLVVEDALVGIQAARNAGMKCLAVATTHPADHLEGADMVLENLTQLPPARLIDCLFNSPGRSAYTPPQDSV